MHNAKIGLLVEVPAKEVAGEISLQHQHTVLLGERNIPANHRYMWTELMMRVLCEVHDGLDVRDLNTGDGGTTVWMMRCFVVRQPLCGEDLMRASLVPVYVSGALLDNSSLGVHVEKDGRMVSDRILAACSPDTGQGRDVIQRNLFISTRAESSLGGRNNAESRQRGIGRQHSVQKLVIIETILDDPISSRSRVGKCHESETTFFVAMFTDNFVRTLVKWGNGDTNFVRFLKELPLIFILEIRLVGHACVKGGKTAIESPKREPVLRFDKLDAVRFKNLLAVQSVLVNGREEGYDRICEQDGTHRENFATCDQIERKPSSRDSHISQVFRHVLLESSVSVVGTIPQKQYETD